MFQSSVHPPPVPFDDLSGQRRRDLIAGFLVSLIALPLCLGIAVASGFPPVAGLTTAIVGGLVATPLGSAPLTIKGPAAGLIVVVLGAVQELGHGDPAAGYRATLAVGCIAALVQIGLAVGRAGVLAELFPTSVLQGLLAAIGVILFSRQAHVLLGVSPVGRGPLELLAEIPQSLLQANIPVVIISVVSAIVLVLWPRFGARTVPSPLLVLLISIPLASAFGLMERQEVGFGAHTWTVGPHLLVQLPASLRDAVVLPDFSQITSATSIKYIVMLAVVATIESVLSARAVDGLDPLRRRPDLSRDLFAAGCGNLVSSMLGGLPMISEIVRSSASVAAGGRTRWANAWHGAFLLLFLTLIPAVIQLVPLAALAAMLVHTAARLASPGLFRAARSVGPEQAAAFAATLITTLATDLLIGVLVGLAVNAALCVKYGAPVGALFRPRLQIEAAEDGAVVRVRGAAVFTNFLSLRRAIPVVPGAAIRIDFTEARVVDHTTLDRLHALSEQLAVDGTHMTISGLMDHKPVSPHPRATRHCLR